MVISHYHRILFSYNNINSLPARNSYEQDVWGYFNDNNASTFKAKLYIYPTRGKDMISSIQAGTPTYTVFASSGADRSADAVKSLYGMLTKITFPTGGKTEFEFESHQFDYFGHTVQGGGVRIKEMKRFENETDSYPVLRTKYTYSNGTLSGIIPQYSYLVSWSSSYDQSSYEDNMVTFVSNQAALGMNNGSHVGYGKVEIEQIGATGQTNGKTEYNYRLESDQVQTFNIYHNKGYTTVANALTTTSHFPFTQFMDKSHRRGLLEKVVVYDDTGQKVLEKVYTFKEFSSVLTHSTPPYTYTYGRPVSVTAGGMQDPMDLYHTINFTQNIDRLLPHKTTEISIDQFGKESRTEITTEYNQHLLVSSQKTLVESQYDNSPEVGWSKFHTKTFKYVFDYAEGINSVFPTMVNLNYLSPVIESELKEQFTGTINSESVLSSELTTFELQDGLITPGKIQYFQSNQIDFSVRDIKSKLGNMVELKKDNASTSAMIWAYNDGLPVISAQNVAYDDLILATNWAIANMSGKPTQVTDLESLLNI